MKIESILKEKGDRRCNDKCCPSRCAGISGRPHRPPDIFERESAGYNTPVASRAENGRTEAQRRVAFDERPIETRSRSISP
jgi:hypothetical protein